jgi:hypothetical protein
VYRLLNLWVSTALILALPFSLLAPDSYRLVSLLGAAGAYLLYERYISPIFFRCDVVGCELCRMRLKGRKHVQPE